jgi:hypothetical protein
LVYFPQIKALLNGVEQPPDDVTDSNGSNALHNAVYYLRLDVTQFLIDLGCNVNLHSKNGHAPLHLVAEEYRSCCGQVSEVIEALVLAGADPKAKNKKGKTAFELASRRKGVPAEALRFLSGEVSARGGTATSETGARGKAAPMVARAPGNKRQSSPAQKKPAKKHKIAGRKAQLQGMIARDDKEITALKEKLTAAEQKKKRHMAELLACGEE